MTTFLHLNRRIVNADHIVSAERFEPEPAGERYESAAREVVPFPAKPFRVVLTLTAIEEIDMSFDGSTYHGYAASKAQTIAVSGDLAEHLWLWFENRADIVNLEKQE